MAVARSADGEHFETLLTIRREELGAESLERPALVPAPDGGWRLYLSCATPGTKHWRVEVLEARHPGAFDARRSRVVLPGDDEAPPSRTRSSSTTATCGTCGRRCIR